MENENLGEIKKQAARENETNIELKELPTDVCHEAQTRIDSLREELMEKYKDHATTIDKLFKDFHDKIAESTEADPGQVGVGVVQK